MAAPMFFAKICSPWREMLIQSYKENQESQEKGGNTGVIYTPGIPEELLLGEDHGGPNKARTYKSGQRSGPTRASSQGSRRTDTRSTGRTPTRRTFRRAHTRTNESFKNCNCWTCGARGHIAPDCPQKRGEIRKFEATDDILDTVYYGELNNYSEEDRLQTSESLSGFFSRMTVSNKTMEIIMRQDSNLSPYDGFRIGGIGKVLNQIGLNQRKHHIIYKVSSGKLMFDIHPMIAYNLADKDFSRVLSLHQDFKRKDLMKEGKSISKFPEFSRNSLSNPSYMLEIAGHEILVTGVAGRENGSMILGYSFLEIINLGKKRERQQGLIDSDSFYEESEEEIKNLKEAMQELKTMDISEEIQLSLENVKRLIQRNFSENPLAWWDRNKIEATLKIKEECKYDSPGFLVRNHGEIKRVLSEKKATVAVNKIEFLGILIVEAGIELQEHIVEKIRNFPDILKDKKHLQSFLGVVNFAGIFIKDLAKYRKDFRQLLKETESAKWKWEEIRTQRVRELKQICNNLPKLAIPQDEDELVVYTDANDYRWAAVLMKRTTTGEEPCRYTGGLFTEQQAKVWHINEK
ncbi:Enzymatic polyprotein [Sesamum angolense]|uniref:Enzymatic polyprotein n=1 Tax=Sesamum angolense TaxID=2727404 RepID=A0AAE2BXG3_9LAMI|nr:Enzymatic polyprotein [Sesamum angolense]